MATGQRDRLYKQSQFAGTDRDGRGPAKSPAELSLGHVAPNKPNLPQTIAKARSLDDATHQGDKCAKQSQFDPETGMDESRQGGRHSRFWDQS